MHMTTAEVTGIYITDKPATPVRPIKTIRAVAGRGLEGDRNFNSGEPAPHGSKQAGEQLTLIESEAIEALARESSISLKPGESRRNLVTRGIALNHLVGKEFTVGKVRALGIRLCEPCSHLESLTHKGVLTGLIHRGGLRAQILSDGEIHVGDRIAVTASK